MTEELVKFEKSIKRKHRFGFTPKYEEEVNTKLNNIVIIPILIKCFERLGWTVIYQDEKSVEGNKEKDLWEWGNKIKVTFEFGKIKVKSISLGNEFWDIGRNSLRVKLFIHVFKEIEEGFDQESIKELETATERANNWEDYKIPESLPQPMKSKESQIWIPIIGGIITALILGLILAFLSVKVIYIIGVYEVGVAFAIGFAFQFLIKFSNYTNSDILNYILIGVVVITYLSSQYFQYQIILNQEEFESFSFGEFMKVRFELGLTIKSLNTGWIGLVLSWLVQLIITYLIGVLRLTSSILTHLIEKVPMEVIDFALYHFVKDKTEEQVRSELAKMGWIEKQNQDEVFESIGAIQGAREWSKTE